MGDEDRTAERLSMPWRYNYLDKYMCEIVTKDGFMIVGHISTDCIQILDDMMIKAGYTLPMPRIKQWE